MGEVKRRIEKQEKGDNKTKRDNTRMFTCMECHEFADSDTGIDAMSIRYLLALTMIHDRNRDRADTER